MTRKSNANRPLPPSANKPGTVYLSKREAQLRVLATLAGADTPLTRNFLKTMAPYSNYTGLCRDLADQGWIEGSKSGSQWYYTITSKGRRELEKSGRLYTFTLAEEVDPLVFAEGAVTTITVNKYERDPKARRACIDYHGTSCCICNFSFAEKYGPVADGFIHVHHVRPLSQIGGAYEVNPVDDLRPVCPNCHAVLHLGGLCRSIAEVRRLLR